MARQKSYARAEAISRARDAFWQHGYQTLGIRAIEELVGVGRFAIRTDFNGKEGLFLEALALYREDGLRYVIQPIREAEDIGVLETLLISVTTVHENSCARYGCLFVNTIVENATLQNPEFRKYTNAHFDDVRDATRALIKRGQQNGTVREDIDAQAAGEFIKGALMTVGLMSRDAQDVTAPVGYVNMAISTIRSWRRSEN